ncbi:dihydrofolate reductase family protein [Cellulosimicrobium sp. NPDC057127]|uniref:dihydrofolate reductase family protein n=1 Tax=Cellulosimicrobium sp. NPDC057127 TaxID=3346026 RepID=UPI0036372679
MTTFHAFLGCSLDGFIAGPDDEIDWLTAFDDVLGETGYDDFFGSVGAVVMGRRSYEVISASGPGFYGTTPVHVLSRTLPPGPQAAMGNSAVTVHRDVPALQATLTEAGAERAYVDGGRTVQGFLFAGLLSDIVITRVPVLVGEGIPLFGPVPAPVRAELVESRVLDAGAVQSVYRFPTDR